MTKKTKIIIISVSVLLVAVVVTVVTCYCSGNLAFVHPYDEWEEGKIRVACVGDSITYGAGIWGWPSNSYPSALEEMLGEDYQVNNFGYSGRCAQNDANQPYVEEKLYEKSIKSSPDIVVIMLGSNDSKPYNFTTYERFYEDYSALIDTYVKLPSVKQIYIMAPPPAFMVNGKAPYSIDDGKLKNEIYTATLNLASEKGLVFIDLYKLFDGKGEYFSDGVHPNAEGAKMIADEVAKSIKDNYVK